MNTALLVPIIAFFRCRFGKETIVEHQYLVINLEVLLLVKYNEVVKIIRRSIMKHQQRKEDILFSVCIFFGAFAINLLIRKLFTTQTLVPMIFVFGVFLISLKTHGYCYGIVSAVLSVFAVNFAFAYP